MKRIYFTIYFLLFIAGVGNAQYAKLLDFAGIANGSAPHGDLISDGTFLYGMTSEGGINNFGVIFKIKPNGMGFTKLFDFDATSIGGADGSLVSDGTFLYGMTAGTIFKIKPDGTGYLKLLDFTGANGETPIGSLIYDGTFLYGMTRFGGANICNQYSDGCGVIFKIRPDGTGYSKLHDFTSLTGSGPLGSLISDGTFLYGMTRAGGVNSSCQAPYGCGTIFKIKSDGTNYIDLYNFDGTTDGVFGSLISDGTFLYGMTPGTIFKIMPDGSGYLKLLDFTGQNGSSANGSLIYDGTFLYGMTREGGTSTNCGSGCGVIFKIKPDGKEYSKLLDFTGINGSDPMGSLFSAGPFLYGMTRTGGTNDMGVIFSLNATTVGVNKVAEKETEINVFPNPTNKTITININSPNSDEEFILRINNSLGQTVYTEKKKYFSGKYVNTIDLGKEAKGIYFVEVVLGSERMSKKIILE